MVTNMEHFPTSTTAREMLGSVTKGWYDRAYVGKWLYQVMGLSMDQVKALYEELPEQFFVETATWGLAYHEQKYGLPIRNGLNVEERRKSIMQRMKSRVPMTPYNMEQLCRRQLGLSAEVSDIHDGGSLNYQPDHPNRFQVIIWEHDTNMVLNYAMVESLIQQVNQSHTVFTVQHRQVFERSRSVLIGSLHTDLVEYEIKPRPINRDVDATVRTTAAVAIDIAVFEEIGR